MVYHFLVFKMLQLLIELLKYRIENNVLAAKFVNDMAQMPIFLV